MHSAGPSIVGYFRCAALLGKLLEGAVAFVLQLGETFVAQIAVGKQWRKAAARRGNFFYGLATLGTLL